MAHFSGLVAAGLHPNPCQYADIVTSTTHKTLRGPRSGLILAKEKYGAAIDKTVFPGMQGGPLVHMIAAKAVCFLEALQPEFVDYQKQVVANAAALWRRALMEAGFRVVSGGTDTHLMLVDVFSKGRARQGSREGARPRAHHRQQERHSVRRESAAESERHPPRTPAVTTRGFREPEMRETGAADRRSARTTSPNEDAIADVRRRVEALTARFPLYAWKLASRQA